MPRSDAMAEGYETYIINKFKNKGKSSKLHLTNNIFAISIPFITRKMFRLIVS